MTYSDYDPTNPPAEVAQHEAARDLILEVSPPADPVEQAIVQDWLDGNIDYSQTEQYNQIIEAVYANHLEDMDGSN